ncbi:methionyl aminopeptidase [Actinopolyspora mzabensis]|uniref:Methionyl aminopeptidase n=1 Tax=Actinopolyspora mzabensis TaxID=995066 RepID=A0A1G8Y1L6_ACTMZ|nr:M24 family metallopeptidase [Actinopolyspora mzabensis]SDJ96681.1 methionyl aminopeptidase [Actinopolyspora mzabensis]
MRHRVELRGEDELELLSSAGGAVAATLTSVGERIRPGVFPADLERHAVASLAECGAAPAVPITAGGARALSLSRDDVVCGGSPVGERLETGELVTVECAASVAGWCAWSAFGTSVGVPTESDLRLTDTAGEALRNGIAAASAGHRLGEVAHAIGVVARGAGCGMPVGCGYGIGRGVREGPVLPAPGKRSTGVTSRPGLVFTVVAGVCASGGDEVVRGQDGVVVTGDGSRACVFGHTVAVTRWGPRVLTSS